MIFYLTKQKGEFMIQVIERVFTILEELSLDGEVSLESLANLTGLNRGTLCNILRSLIELGYVKRSRSSHYELTSRFRELVNGVHFPENEKAIFRQTVESIAESTGESGVLSIMHGDRVAVVTQAQHPRVLMLNTIEIYAALSLYHSVSGRILVSHMDQDARIGLCSRTGFPGSEWDDTESFEELEKTCSKIRRDGISVMKNPKLGIISFAVPVFWKDNVMSLGLTMPIFRCSFAERKTIIEQLKQHADRLSRTSGRRKYGRRGGK